MVYDDPKESWDSCIKKMLLEEIANSKFDKFVEEPSVPSFYRMKKVSKKAETLAFSVEYPNYKRWQYMVT